MSALAREIANRVVVMKVMTDDDNGPWVISIDGRPFRIADPSDDDQVILTSFEMDRRAVLRKRHDERRGKQKDRQ